MTATSQDRHSAPDPEEKPSEETESADKDPKETAELSPEEQMARFEEEMKNEDWGHQPC